MKSEFEDIVVVYPSEHDKGLFVAHSLRTDQVGVADNPVDALLELCLAVRDLLEEADRNSRVVVEKVAPEAVQRILIERAKWMPDQIWEEVQRRLHTQQGCDADYWEPYKFADSLFETLEEQLFYRDLQREDLLATA